MIISNYQELATTKQRADVLEIISSGIERVLPENVLKEHISFNSSSKILIVDDDRYELQNRRVFVIGAGKSSGEMARVFEEIVFPENIVDGVVNCTDTDYSLSKIVIKKASHPVPDEQGVEGTRKMMNFKDDYEIGEKDIFIDLLSGGGSALMPLPVEGVNLQEKKEVTKLLLQSGVEIHEINAIRKHLSAVKGGQLARHFEPATVLSLIISDVIGNDLDVIASGPTVADTSTFEEAYRVLEKYKLLERVPVSVRKHIERGREGKIEDTPKRIKNAKNYILGDNQLALKAMGEKARGLGYDPYIIKDQKGEPGKVIHQLVDMVTDRDGYKHELIIMGGETTPVLPKNHGKGGRNQHLVCEAMLAMNTIPKEWVFASCGTDGSDYVSDVAGAIVDSSTFEKMKKASIDVEKYIERYDSYTLFEKFGTGQIITGNTGTNVCDIAVLFRR